jgi:adenylate cyclase class 2
MSQSEILNVEIKAKVTRDHQRAIRDLIRAKEGVTFAGQDNQTDTYVNVPSGRLKVREGNVENALVQYHRDNVEGPKDSKCIVVKMTWDQCLAVKQALSLACGVIAYVHKNREIYFLPLPPDGTCQAKLHLDEVPGLGQFVEIEVSSPTEKPREVLLAHCQRLMEEFNLHETCLYASSYCDLVMATAHLKKVAQEEVDAMNTDSNS